MKARRAAWALAAGLVLLGAGSLPASPRLIWNRTQSLPEGLYLISPEAALNRGDTVAYKPQANEALFLESRGYTGPGWPLIKRVAAIEGDTVCRIGTQIQINARPAADALTQDGGGRSLPSWDGCRHLLAGEVFLLADHPRSVDGRYFGVQHRGRILGRARLIWTTRRDDGQDTGRVQYHPAIMRESSDAR